MRRYGQELKAVLKVKANIGIEKVLGGFKSKILGKSRFSSSHLF